MSYPVRQILSLASAVANGIAQSQTPSVGGVQNLTLNGSLVSSGVATLDVARRVIVTSAADDTGITITVYGTNRDNITQQESFLGASGAAAVSNKDFKTVTRITVSGNTAGAVTAGTNGMASTAWIMTDHYQKHRVTTAVGVKVFPGSTLNYTVQATEDDLQDITYITNPSKFVTANNNASTAIANATVSGEGGYAAPPVAIRLTFNSYTTGSAEITVV